MKTFELKGEIREDFGKKASRAYRRERLIPCVVYGGKDEENINFVVKQGDVLKLIYTHEVFLVNLDLGKKKMMAMVKELQFHPVRDEVMHIDFLYVFEDKPVTIEIPVSLKGLAAGVKAGGKISLDLRKLKVRGLAANLPETLNVDVTKLKLGKSIQVGELDFENLEILNSKNAVVCRVQLTRAARGEAAKSDEGGDDDAGSEGETGAEAEE